ncbi:MAG TPA: protein kinase [Gemmataceae bacterium]|nr:protein kinase [Gemmataceae bacterium]
MARLKVLFRCIGEAVCAQGLRGLAGVVPFGEVVYDVAREVLERFRHYQDEEEMREALQDAVQAAMQEVKEEARAVAHEVAADQPPEIELRLADYLVQVPALIRQSFKRPADALGRSLPARLVLEKAEDLLPFLPARLPRFKPGDCPPGVGDWELVELLGVGGFGEVWKARHRFFDGIAPVALKFCLDPAAQDRLLKHEAGVLNQVMRHGRHPGIVPLLDAALGADPPCLKYEYIEGGDLSGLLREWIDLAPAERWPRATRVVAQLARIVGHAHRLSPPIVHRDLKPANILVAACGFAEGAKPQAADLVLKITDFGIGSVAALEAIRESRQGSATRGGVLASSLRGAHTPLYASPQQMRGDAPDVRDDVHALGVIWYQMLIGDLGSGAPTGLWSEDLEGGGLSRDLIRLLGACVAAKPERRPRDAAALAEQLDALLVAPAPAPVRVVAAPPPRREPEPPPAPHDPIRELLRSIETTPSLWLLDLTNKGIGDEGVKALAALPALANRSTIILSGNGIGDEGVKALAASRHVVNLSKLVLWDNHIGDEGVKALAESPNLAGLSTLDLGRNRVGDEGAIALAASPQMAGLSALILVSNQIGDAGAAAIAASPHLANLAELKPLNNRIGAAGVTALREAFGKRVRIY